MFPVYVMEDGMEMPDDDVAYLICKDGIFLKKKVGLIQSLAKVDSISVLGNITPYAHFDVAMVPEEIILQALAFFRSIYEKHKAEAAVILEYDQEAEEYSLNVPEQEVTFSHVKYKPEKTSSKLHIGSIHSHCSFSAFHSGTDTSDEAEWDGIHITLGHVDTDIPSLSIETVANKQRFMVYASDYIDMNISEDEKKKPVLDVTGIELPEVPEEWLAKVNKKVYVPKTYKYGRYGRSGGHSITSFYSGGGFDYDKYLRKIGHIPNSTNNNQKVDPKDKTPVKDEEVYLWGDQFELDDPSGEWPLLDLDSEDAYHPCGTCPYLQYKNDILVDMMEIEDDEEFDEDDIEVLTAEEDGERIELIDGSTLPDLTTKRKEGKKSKLDVGLI